ncbi:TraU family protein [Desulfurivibrio sp. D14AmB]|uniref:TraU family protein n=1 Tax=Desulfurivibrio sp. D14AmB TaxID=3374370 RepID=UPI00376F2B4F
MKTKIFPIITILALAGVCPAQAGIKSGSMMNPISEVSWNEIFPIKIGGVEITGSNNYDNDDAASEPTCYCQYSEEAIRYGVPLSMWEPARMIETVATPYYFPFLGEHFDESSGEEGGPGGEGAPGEEGAGGGFSGAYLSGKNAEMDPASQEMSSFAQAHYWIFPVWAIMGMFTDTRCVDGGGMDLGYMTELDSLWQDAEASAIIHPEAILFANPIAQISCIADSVAVNVWAPLDAMYWCIGSSGSAYSMTGHIDNENLIQANAGVAARLLYKLHRQLLVCDAGIDLCYCVPMPIWRKSNYKLHAVRPAVRRTAYPIGKSQFFYGTGLNPPYRGAKGPGDEFLWMLFWKRACCAS